MSDFYDTPGITDLNGDPYIPPMRMAGITEPPLTNENPFDDLTTQPIIVGRNIVTNAGTIFVNTLGIFTQGYKTMCEIGNKILKMAKKTTTSCAISVDNSRSSFNSYKNKLDKINDKIYNLLDGDYILVLSCNEIEAERQQYVESEYEVYTTICQSKNLWLASDDPEVIDLINESFILDAKSKGRMNEQLEPTRLARLLFLIELMFTADGPSYLTNTTDPEIQETYSALTRTRRLMNQHAIDSNLSVVYNSSGRKVRIFKPKYMYEDAPPGKVYPRGTSVEEIHQDFPVKGNYKSQLANYERLVESAKNRKNANKESTKTRRSMEENTNRGLSETDNYNIPVSGYKYNEGWADEDNLERGGKKRRRNKKTNKKRNNKTKHRRRKLSKKRQGRRK